MKLEDFKFRKFYDVLVDDRTAKNGLWALDTYWVRPKRHPQPYGAYDVMIKAVQQWIPLAEANDYRTWVIEWRLAYQYEVTHQKARKRVLSQPHNENTPLIQSGAAAAADRLDALIWLRHKAKEMYKTLVADNAPTSIT